MSKELVQPERKADYVFPPEPTATSPLRPPFEQNVFSLLNPHAARAVLRYLDILELYALSRCSRWLRKLVELVLPELSLCFDLNRLQTAQSRPELLDALACVGVCVTELRASGVYDGGCERYDGEPGRPLFDSLAFHLPRVEIIKLEKYLVEKQSWSFIGQFESLQELYVTSPTQGKSAPDWSVLNQLFRSLRGRQLRVLRLKGCQLLGSSDVEFANTLHDMEDTLESFEIESYQSWRRNRNFIRAITSLKHLRELRVNDCICLGSSSGVSDSDLLLNFFESQGSLLEVCWLPCAKEISSKVHESIAQHCTQLRELGICASGSSTALQPLDVLPCTLTTLSLNSYTIDRSTLMTLLRQCSSLRSITFVRVAFAEVGEIVGTLLAEDHRIESIDLNKCKFQRPSTNDVMLDDDLPPWPPDPQENPPAPLQAAVGRDRNNRHRGALPLDYVNVGVDPQARYLGLADDEYEGFIAGDDVDPEVLDRIARRIMYSDDEDDLYSDFSGFSDDSLDPGFADPDPEELWLTDGMYAELANRLVEGVPIWQSSHSSSERLTLSITASLPYYLWDEQADWANVLSELPAVVTYLESGGDAQNLRMEISGCVETE